ncbi:MAG: hypothetical protein M3065_16875 [Actinomycetota bacterium]|nr:hypothetical protein [Actinomycetota bacterium]
MADASTSGPEAQVRALYEQAETQAARASEELVGSRGFGGLLGQLAENAAAVTKLSSDAMDLVLRNLRVAGRRDVVRLARQLARTEDKLERVLQEVEQLREELARPRTETSQKSVSPVKPKDARASRGSAARGSEHGKSP